MDPCILVTGERIRSQALESTLGSMVDVTRENGLITTWKEWVSISGTMVGCIRDSIRMTKSMGLESILGLIRDVMKGTGTRENNMGSEHISCPRITKSSLDSGKMENVFNGSMRLRSRVSTMDR